MQPELAIVIPTLDEAGQLPETLEQLQRSWPNADVIVVDGGSRDRTVALARSHGAKVLELAQSSRGKQLCAGAMESSADWILFLHADTQVPEEAVAVADAYRTAESRKLAMFQIRFDDASWGLRLSAWFTRFDSVFTRFGDQGILISRSYYLELGGFRPWPLFEDVDLVRRARRLNRIDVLPAVVVTSARRFRRRGVWRQQLGNGLLLLRYLAGADPVKLAAHYTSCREDLS